MTDTERYKEALEMYEEWFRYQGDLDKQLHGCEFETQGNSGGCGHCALIYHADVLRRVLEGDTLDNATLNA